MMDDLITFLRARLDEDSELLTERHLAKILNERGGSPNDYPPGYDVDARERADGSREGRDIAAKRAIIDLHQITPREAFGRAEYTCRECDWTPEEHLWNVGPACPTIRLLALPYAGHPDYYREEWMP